MGLFTGGAGRSTSKAEPSWLRRGLLRLTGAHQMQSLVGCDEPCQFSVIPTDTRGEGGHGGGSSSHAEPSWLRRGLFGLADAHQTQSLVGCDERCQFGVIPTDDLILET